MATPTLLSWNTCLNITYSAQYFSFSKTSLTANDSRCMSVHYCSVPCRVVLCIALHCIAANRCSVNCSTLAASCVFFAVLCIVMPPIANTISQPPWTSALINTTIYEAPSTKYCHQLSPPNKLVPGELPERQLAWGLAYPCILASELECLTDWWADD